MATKIVISPNKYVQGKGELCRIESYANKLGKKSFVIADSLVMKLVKDTIKESFENSGSKVEFQEFKGECSKNEINRLIAICQQNAVDNIIGVGGGKTLDTAKAIAYYLNLPVMVVPTIASTDAPCSALSVIYTDKGEFDEYLILPHNPQVVLMDTSIIAKAPVRLLVAGMGDALATYFEARACLMSKSLTMAGGQPTQTAFSLAKLCYATLQNDGLKAKLAAENNTVSTALENIIEANTYLSGIGFESGGLAAAHSVHNGFTVLKELHHLYHGEKVAFGTIVQLVLENAPLDEIREVIDFCISIGLPVTLKDMGLKKIKESDILKVATAATSDGETIHNMPFKVAADDVYAAILSADKIGSMYI